MRNAGKAGEEIINALTANSVTFESKSEYAQEKYRWVERALLGGHFLGQ